MDKHTWNLILATYAMDASSYIPYNYSDSEEEFEEGCINLPSPDPGPEDIAIAKNLYNHLSQEAKQILSKIFDSPIGEKNLTKGFFWRLINSICFSSKCQRKVLKELKNFPIYLIKINAKEQLKISKA